MSKKLAIIYFSADLLLIALCASFGAIYVLNSQAALICSTLIVFASFFSYKNRVKKRAANADIKDFDEVFDDEAENSENSNLKNSKPENSENSKDIKDYKKEYKKAKIPFRFYDIISAFSPLRIIAYLLLVVAFFVLLRHGLFEPISFLAGLAIMPFSSLLGTIFIKNGTKIA